VRPLAIVIVPDVSRVAQAAESFVRQIVPDVAVGLVDDLGYRLFFGTELESLNARPLGKRAKPRAAPALSLFSDLNQWMLKVLLARHVHGSGLMPPLPDGEVRNASDLARAASVSVMSAFRLLRLLKNEGFLHEEPEPLRLVRIEALLERWRAANLRKPRELGARWVLRQGGEKDLDLALNAIAHRACIGLFGAARLMGLGHAHGVPLHIYVDEFASIDLAAAGLMRVPDDDDHRDVVLRMPAFPQSVFRGAVARGNRQICDVLQVWLDVSDHPARGREQADVIFRKVLKPMIERANAAARR
jgi:hypothetical protein